MVILAWDEPVIALGAGSFGSELLELVLRAVREGRVLRLTESSANRPSPRAPDAVRSLRARLRSFTDATPSGDPR